MQNVRPDFPLDRPVTWFLERQSAETPDAPAVTFEGQTISYAELNRRTNKLARHLGSLGVGPETFVAVYMERSVEMVVALVAVVKAGGAYVPFDPEYPADRLTYMFEDTAPTLVLAQTRFGADRIPETYRRLDLDRPEWASTTPSDDENLPLRSTPDTACYMIYTSGSTGRPKGVVNIHRGLVNRLWWMQEEYGLTAADTVLQKTPYSFDVSVWEFFWPLMFGARIVMARPGGHKDSGYLVQTIASERVTTMHFVPSMLSLFVAAEGLDRLANLRQVMCSGEALPYALTQRFFDRLPQVRLHNLYGPTEAAIDVTYWECLKNSDRTIVPIGRAIANIEMFVLDDQLKPVPDGGEGEIHIGGVGLARGYWNRPELTAEKFIPSPFEPGERLYKTGDLGRFLPDGAIEYLGRLDFQVKLRGFRIELGEIEAALMGHPQVAESVVTATTDALEEKQLVAYLVAKDARPPVPELRRHLLKTLPDYMVPARFVFLDVMPLLPNGKVNRKALPSGLGDRPELAEMYLAPRSPLERRLAALWAHRLGLQKVGVRDNFFELGGNSLLAIRLSADLRQDLEREVPVVKLFQYPTVEKLVGYLEGGDERGAASLEDSVARARRLREGGHRTDIAVVGMAGRFPGAPDLDTLWSNLVNGVESIRRFSPEELGPGIDDEVKNDPNYVPTRGILDDADKFDAAFFGIGPLEAKTMDPQHRIFLELSWAALENAGYDPARFPGLVGVYAGAGDNHYYTRNVLAHPDIVKTVGSMIVGYGNEKDYISTRVSYTLNLTGPAVSSNTGCSTSLLAVDQAVKALQILECDMALAGGADVYFPQNSGQLYTEGGTFTQDGHCRPFDAEATGTMFCDGAGLVVLKRLDDAVAAGDRIYAVIKGIAKNNDGANKVSFLAPSVEGQARVIALAQAQAGITADTIGYVEAHGTGTPLGDPIEVEALTKAFRATIDKNQFCWLGSIKGNIGHSTIASGVAGFLKAALALHHETIPGTINFRSPNPKIPFAETPFRVADRTIPWPRGTEPRRAAVSSFGFGGTNVHAVLEEAPAPVPGTNSRSHHLLVVSAKSEAALNRHKTQLAAHFASHPDLDLADAAFTLAEGRQPLAFRDFVVARDPADAAVRLQTAAGARVTPLSQLHPEVVFLFPGQGSQYVNMGRDLYRTESVFRHWVDQCCDLLKPHLDRDLRELLFPLPGDEATATESLKNTYYTQPALFTIEYALARWWISLGVVPSALVGHSVGEFVAAAISGIFALEDVVPLVALRGRLIRDLPRGSMLSVRAGAATIEGRLPADIQLAAANSPQLCVVAGPEASVAAFASVLEAEGVASRPLHTSHAFHSAMMDPVVPGFVEAVGRAPMVPGQIPILSTCTGTWLDDDTATDPAYWGRHLRMPVRFSDAVAALRAEPGRVYLEVGPRDVLATLARQQADATDRDRIVASLAVNADEPDELTAVLSAVGHLWRLGRSVDPTAFWEGQSRRRVPLPTYPFEKVRHFLEPAEVVRVARQETTVAESAVPEAVAAGRDPLMQALSQMLEETLGRPLEARDEEASFLTLGADSLLLMQLGRVVQSRYGLPVTFRQLVEEYATPRLLVEAMRGKVPQPAAARPEPSGVVVDRPRDLVPGTDDEGQPAWWVSGPSQGWSRVVQVLGPTSYLVDPTTRSEPLQAPRGWEGAPTASQAMWWKLTTSAPDPSQAIEAATDAFEVSLRGNFDPQLVAEAVRLLGWMHPILGGRFSADGQRFLIPPSAQLPLYPAPGPQFSLTEGPLAAVSWRSGAPGETLVTLAAHRTVADGWSLDNLLENLGQLVSALAGTGAHPLPPSMPFPQLHARLMERDQSHPAAFPSSRSCLTSVSATVDLSPDAATAARALAHQQGVSLFAVVLAAVADVVGLPDRPNPIGVPLAGHPDWGAESSVGPLARLAVVHVVPRPEGTFLTQVAEAHRGLLTARDQGEAGPVRITFSQVHHYQPDRLRFGSAQAEYRAPAKVSDVYDFSGELIEDGAALRLRLQGRPADHSGGTLVHLVGRIQSRMLSSSWNGTVTPISIKGIEVQRPIVVTLNRGTAGMNPLFCLLGIQLYSDLASQVTDGTPVVGIHIPMLYDPRLDHRPTLRQVADQYVSVIRAYQPRGPYRLAGLCLGGMVAFEVARRLEADGELVPLVVLFDAVLPQGRHTDLVRLMGAGFRRPAQAVGRGIEKLLGRKTIDPGRALNISTAGGPWVDLPLGEPGVVRGIDGFASDDRPLTGRLIAFRAALTPLPRWDIVHPDMGWAGKAAQTEFRSIDADHLDIVRPPHVQEVARVLGPYLKD